MRQIQDGIENQKRWAAALCRSTLSDDRGVRLSCRIDPRFTHGCSDPLPNEHHFMKSFRVLGDWSSLFALAFVLLALVFPHRSIAALISLSADKTELNVGETIDVTVSISGVNSGFVWPLRSWALSLGWTEGLQPQYPTSLDGYILGDFGGVSTPGEQTGTFRADYRYYADPPNIYMQTGTTCPNAPCISQQSSFPLVTIHFRAVEWNTAAGFVVKGDVRLTDVYQQSIPVEFDQGRELVTHWPGWWVVSNLNHIRINQIPEPTSLALLSLGLVGLGFVRRKR